MLQRSLVEASVSCVAFLAADQISLLPILSVASFPTEYRAPPRVPAIKAPADKLTGAPCGRALCVVGTRRRVCCKILVAGAPWPPKNAAHTHIARFFTTSHRDDEVYVYGEGAIAYISRYEECIAIDRRSEAVGPRALLERVVVRGRILFC